MFTTRSDNKTLHFCACVYVYRVEDQSEKRQFP